MNRPGARSKTVGGAVFRSVACAGANERSECCGPVAGGGDGPPASARRYCAEKGVRPELGLSFEVSLSRFAESPALSVPLGTPTGGLHNLRGVGDGPNFLRRGGPKRAGNGQEAAAFRAVFLGLRSFCRIGENRSPAAGAGERKEILSSPESKLGKDTPSKTPVAQLRCLREQGREQTE